MGFPLCKARITITYSPLTPEPKGHLRRPGRLEMQDWSLSRPHSPASGASGRLPPPAPATRRLVTTTVPEGRATPLLPAPGRKASDPPAGQSLSPPAERPCLGTGPLPSFMPLPAVPRRPGRNKKWPEASPWALRAAASAVKTKGTASCCPRALATSRPADPRESRPLPVAHAQPAPSLLWLPGQQGSPSRGVGSLRAARPPHGLARGTGRGSRSGDLNLYLRPQPPNSCPVTTFSETPRRRLTWDSLSSHTKQRCWQPPNLLGAF